MTYKTSVHLAADLSRLALDIANQPAPVDMINRVAQLAGGLIDRAAADLITITGKGRLRVVASSDPGLSAQTATVWRAWPHTTISQGGAPMKQPWPGSVTAICSSCAPPPASSRN